METFPHFKSQCSVTKHIIPLIKLTYYTFEWYCLNDSRASPPPTSITAGRFFCFFCGVTRENVHRVHAGYAEHTSVRKTHVSFRGVTVTEDQLE